MRVRKSADFSASAEPGAAQTVPYFITLFGCLFCFSFRSFACFIDFCFWPFSLSFLPPLSPIVCLLWRCRSYFCFLRTCVPHEDVTRSAGRRQEQWRSFPVPYLSNTSRIFSRISSGRAT